MKTFMDTGAWLAVVVQTDQYHDVGVLHYEALISRRERLFTSDYVLDETVTRIRYGCEPCDRRCLPGLDWRGREVRFVAYTARR
jgi:predicted nucleic acid-binding protein